MKIIKNTFPSTFTILGLFSLLIVACSGGSLESDTDQVQDKVLVNAGPDKTVNEESVITLNAQASGQSSSLTYRWTVTPNLTITHADTSNGVATAIAPTTSESLVYTFTAVVIDADGNRGTDQVVYTVAPINTLPIAVISVPQFTGLAINQFPAGETIILDASRSLDPDATANTVPIAGYSWQQIAGEPVLSGISTQGDNLLFTTPILIDENTITIALTVTDQEGAEHTESVDLLIQSASQTLPKVKAGVDHEVFSGESINLYGQASTNVSSSNPLSSLWLNDSDTSPVISNDTSLQTYAIAPQVLQEEQITFTLQVRDLLGNQVEDNLTVTVKPLPLQPINDTGVYQQASNTQVLTNRSHVGDYPGQDGQRGQDVIHANNMSAKAGRGEQGFDFTKLDDVGDEVDDPSQDWSCVRDNITGLIWEVKSAAISANLYSNDHTYTWYQDANNGEFDGDVSGTVASCGLALCNTTEYVAEVNTQGLCNFRDWRLPTHEELLSIVHFGQQTAPLIDQTYFPYTTDMLTPPVWYWTQDSSADGIATNGAHNAWAIDFATGNDNFLNKFTAANIRLVRAGR
ncbi:DUF1566 domain-containing protein [Paraglaciecola aquimarina]|uniref:DUF1566 domain-containing protein n=2 Tax=Paraglaciecola algarum TaxID=3050085 RepID=A0ABS9D9D3_9ALTE|nr:DUF1566 domain-containing protein [Paraglaciecola sp. G1-23]MCF2948266.1 DUF1566 domain-containing protein [Paraglaciecola sp. G1-23]